MISFFSEFLITNDFIIFVIATTVRSCSNLGSKTNHYTAIHPLNNNKVLCDGDAFPKALNQNVNVSSGSSTWSYPSYPLSQSSWVCRHINYHNIYYWQNRIDGTWGTSEEKYVGLKLQIGNKTYYGWLRMVAQNSVFTVKDYAYDSKAGHKILTGATSGTYAPTVDKSVIVDGSVSDTPPQIDYSPNCHCRGYSGYGCGANDACKLYCGVYCRSHPGHLVNDVLTFDDEISTFIIYPNPVSSLLTLKLSSSITIESTIQIINLFGQVVYFEKINDEETQIDISRLPKGIYVMKWNCGEKIESKTFSVIK